eukprot:CAMPEP_0171910606 /NCGR_PEP_ID=MMETSP0993-20121228/9547_1 /TAXON_ID=483369 /ORGANISM="non described non described, Strain CCMP2098" /LENGTH=246 /DNA_ID=CAMNT_0012543823 /DNA_START=111 /DNA_END=847 /DNA_ORIENTATION=+
MSLNPNAMEFSPARPQMSEGDEPKRKRKKGKERAPPTPSQLLMREVGQACKTNDALRGLSAYRTARDASTPILPQTFNSLLALVSGLSHHIQGGPEGAEAGAAASAPASGGSAEAAGKESGGVADAIAAAAATSAAAATPPPSPAATLDMLGAAMELYRDATAAGVRLQEPSYTSLIRVCGAEGNVAEGLRLLAEMPSVGALPRLRTFLPLLEACVASGDADGAFTVYDLIRKPVAVKANQQAAAG